MRAPPEACAGMPVTLMPEVRPSAEGLAKGLPEMCPEASSCFLRRPEAAEVRRPEVGKERS
jgi:hypothetical protein